ncbi:leucine-rich repeat domain-containing glycoprotein 150 isoform 1-T2 [Glossina fuscipes fuscipes]
MLRQSRLVLLLLLTLEVVQVAFTSTPLPYNFVHDDIPNNLLDLDDESQTDLIKSHIKLSTPQEKYNVTIPTNTLSETKTNNNATTTKAPEIVINRKRVNAMTTTSKTVDDNYDDEYDNYEYDDDIYDSYDESSTSTTASTKATKKTKGKTKLNNSKEIFRVQMKPIKGDIKTSTVKDLNLDNNESNAIESHEKTLNSDEDDYDDEDDDEDDDDDDDDDDDEDFDTVNSIHDEEEVEFTQSVPCPRYCICERNVNSYLVAYCSRIDPGTQKFGKDITDLVVTDVSPKYPILLGPNFFLDLGLKYVSSIKIANCSIEYLHPDAFSGLDELYAVNLTNVGLAIMNPDTFAKNKKLRLLTITGNDLSVMSSVHYLLKSSSLEELDLSRNNLMELNPHAFSQLSNIIYINLSQNNLQKIPEGIFDQLQTIEELDLSYNSLKSLPANIFNGTALAILHLKYNSITNDLRFATADLQQLDLSFNQIHQVHHGMFDRMTGLTNLNLKGNGLTKIQTDSFLSLKNLRHIDLSINELNKISSMIFYKNAGLDVIRLNDNPRLSELPTDGFRSHNGYFTVYYFDISNCAIGALGHKTFSTMPHLTTLKLAWNNINNLDRDTFASLKKLIDLDLSNNLISKLDDLIFMRNNDLTKLNLAGNPIRKLSVRLFLPFNKLRELDVSDCELTSLLSDNQFGVGRKYKFYQTLHSFNASANQIRKISSVDVRNFKNLRSLDITQNPIKCNDGFQDFIGYVSLNTEIMPYKMPSLDSIVAESTSPKIQAELGWSSLAHHICKHLETETEPKNQYNKKNKLPKYNTEDEKDENDKQLLTVLEDLESHKILRGKSEKKKKLIEALSDNYDEGRADNAEEEDTDEKYNNAEEIKDDDTDSSYSDDDDEEEPEDIAANDDEYEDYEKKAKISKNVKDHGVKVEEIDLSKETENKYLLDKFLAQQEKHLNNIIRDEEEEASNDDDDDEDDDEEFIIEHGRIYYSGYRFMIPIIIIVTSVLLLLLIIAKVVSMVMRKRGERYRMSLLQAHKNSIVYQKLSEEIKPPKEPKQPKVHRYAPISVV